MLVKSLLLRNFRNYKEEKIFFAPQTNIFYGANAQGKTNLLEALVYLGLGGSFRESRSNQLINWQESYFYLEILLQNHLGENIVSAACQKEGNIRLWKKDGQPCRRLSEIVGFCHVVFFLPDDLELIKKGPSYRRLFFDREMVQLFSDYYIYLNQYRRALLQRNELLRLDKSSHTDDEISVWEEKMAQSAAVIMKKRAVIAGEIAPLAKEAQKKIGGAEELSISYAPAASCLAEPKDIALAETAFLQQGLIKLWEEKRKEDRQRGYTSYGPHRDDFMIKIDGKNSRCFASQGQQRTAALSLKIAEMELACRYKKEYPLLLLDDVFSELDGSRKKQLLSLIKDKAQSFITTTDEVLSYPEGKSFFITGGKVIYRENN